MTWLVTDESETTERVKEEGRADAGGEERPLGSFMVLMGTYGAMVAGLSGAVRLSGRRLPERLGWSGLALLTVATTRSHDC